MSWFRKFPGFALSLLLLSLCVLGEAGLIAERWNSVRSAKKQLDQAKRELHTLGTVQPTPTARNAALIDADFRQLTESRETLELELTSRSDVAEEFNDAAEPNRRPEAFFDIATFVLEMRGRARAAGVWVRPDERFSFASYANEAPQNGQLAQVFRERQVVEYLLGALFDAHSRQLLAVQRTRRRAKPDEVTSVNSGGLVGGSADYFEMDPRLSLRVANVVETTGYRLSFTGSTSTLRALLLRVAEYELPLVVRAVEVAPADRLPESSGPARSGATAPAVSIYSRFTVTLEFITLAHPTEAVT